jgi:NOL1/NOP2/fmu family ribosome biogenesis protein
MAMNALVKTENRIVDVSTDIALSYLRRELVDVNTELRGWILLRSEGVILGWVKKMDNRINNYYPTEWRIRKV